MLTLYTTLKKSLLPIRKVDKYTVHNDIWSTDRRLTLRADRVESLPVRYVRSPLPCPSARAGATAPPPRACPWPVPRHPEVVHGDEGVRMRAAALMEFPICDWNRGRLMPASLNQRRSSSTRLLDIASAPPHVINPTIADAKTHFIPSRMPHPKNCMTTPGRMPPPA